MSTLFWLWLVSFALTLALLVRGFVRAKMVPVSYEWSWSPLTFVSASLFPKGRLLWARVRAGIQQSLHRLFHAFFHQMKRFHDRVFGKSVLENQGTPSFFLKSIAEHKDEHVSANSEERKNGLS